MDPLYQAPLAKLTPGDVFVDIPSIYLRAAELTFLRRRQGPHGPLADLYVLGGEGNVPTKPFDPNGDEVAVPVQVTNGILLTHGCEIDNRPKACVSLALIRPIAPLPGEAKENIRRGRNLSFMWLPDNDDPPLPESYVDFSRISAVRPAALDQGRRIVSASAELLEALYVGLVRCFTRWEISGELLALLVQESAPRARGTGG